MNVFVFGLGYSACRWIERDRARFGRIVGTVRAPEAAADLARRNVTARIFDGDRVDPRIVEDIAASEGLLVSIPPAPKQDCVDRITVPAHAILPELEGLAGFPSPPIRGRSSESLLGDPVLARFAAAIAAAPRLRWIGYLSTIGVYGDRGGDWIDETAPARPMTGRSRQRLAAEQAWLELGERAGKAVHVFRLAGIYGPGRNALRQLANGTARRIVKPGQVFNRIHVDDIAAVLSASTDRPRAGAIYNVSDDEPAPPQDVVAFAAGLMGIAPPPEIPFEEAGLDPLAASFYAETKRVRNRLIKEELGVRLAFPTYREGLRALFASGEGRPQGLPA